MMNSILNDLWAALVKPFKDKYFVSSILLLFWLTFFDGSNFFVRYNLASKIEWLESEKARLEAETERNKAKIEELRSDKNELEKFAREEYFMKKDNEVIFIVK